MLSWPLPSGLSWSGGVGGHRLNDPDQQRVVRRSNAPIFFSFFTWGFGSGAQQLARPLFAYALTESVFLVSLVIALNAVPRLFIGPISGLLTDRFGRKPLAMMGAGLRGTMNVAQFFAGDFTTFLVLEFVGQIGVATWNTSSSVLIADVTSTANRGRVQAIRQMAQRMGFVAGPALGGVLAASVGLSWLFMLNGISKLLIVAIVLFLVKETKPESVPHPDVRQAKRDERAVVRAAVRQRSFVALALVMIGTSMSQTSVIQTLLPVHAVEHFGVGEGQIGLLIGVAAALAFVVALPNGMLSDRFGRKVSMVPGLALLAVGLTLLALVDTYWLMVFAVAVQGSGEGMAMGTSRTYAMDLAPRERRGTFLGFVMIFQAAGAISGPLVIGAVYHGIGPAAGFGTLAVWVFVSAIVMAVAGKETAGGRVPPRAAVR